MNYIKRTKTDIKENFTINLLKDRGILDENSDLNAYFHPTKDNLLPPEDLDNMDAGFQMFKHHLEQGSKVVVVVDSDVDGFTSASAVINYMNDYMKELYPNIQISYHVPEGKEHGLRSIMDYFTESCICDLILIPDAATNDDVECEQLKDLGYDILILDHHIQSRPNESAIVINNQSSPRYENKDLSGVGVVYKFLQYCDKQFNISGADDYLDLVALGQISDMVSLNTSENRFICEYGLSHIKNTMFQALVEKQSYSISSPPTQIDVAFYITPLINALIRVGTSNEKELLFRGFLNDEELVRSTKRGASYKDMESIAEQSARNCVNAKSRQNRIKEQAMELLDIQISNNCLDENKILVVNADELDIPRTLTGLVAMGIAAKYKKPTILGRITPDGKTLKGSIRGRDNSPLKDFRQFLLDSELMEFVEGHSNASGFALPIKNLDRLISYANFELDGVDFNEGSYDVDFVVNGNCSYLEDLINNLAANSNLWGQANEEPVIAIEDINLDKSLIQVIGKNQDTLKFNFNGITYVKFKATEIIEKLNTLGQNVIITCVGRGNINEWQETFTPQILVDAIDVKESSIYDF